MISHEKTIFFNWTLKSEKIKVSYYFKKTNTFKFSRDSISDVKIAKNGRKNMILNEKTIFFFEKMFLEKI